MESLEQIWHDNVWGKVIAGLILAALGSIWPAIKFKWWSRLTAHWSIKLTLIHANVSYHAGPGIGFPLKYHVEMRNDSSQCVEVRVFNYIPDKITIKSFPPEAMQVRFHAKWFPTDLSEERVAVLPGQLCRAWIGIDDGKFNEEQVKASVGSMGTLIVTANKKHISFKL